MKPRAVGKWFHLSYEHFMTSFQWRSIVSKTIALDQSVREDSISYCKKEGRPWKIVVELLIDVTSVLSGNISTLVLLNLIRRIF